MNIQEPRTREVRGGQVHENGGVSSKCRTVASFSEGMVTSFPIIEGGGAVYLLFWCEIAEMIRGPVIEPLSRGHREARSARALLLARSSLARPSNHPRQTSRRLRQSPLVEAEQEGPTFRALRVSSRRGCVGKRGCPPSPGRCS
jgi:hypothetical protein